MPNCSLHFNLQLTNNADDLNISLEYHPSTQTLSPVRVQSRDAAVTLRAEVLVLVISSFMGAFKYGRRRIVFHSLYSLTVQQKFKGTCTAWQLGSIWDIRVVWHHSYQTLKLEWGKPGVSEVPWWAWNIALFPAFSFWILSHDLILNTDGSIRIRLYHFRFKYCKLHSVLIQCSLRTKLESEGFGMMDGT